MISGLKTEALPAAGARPWLVRLAAIALLACLSLPALAFDLPTLMALLAERRSGEAAFSEQRFVSGLDSPLWSSGSLSFEAPDRFVRRTLKPRPETMEVEGNKVTLSRGGRSRSFSLDAAPEMLGLVESVRATLTGNGAAIRRHFKAELSGDAEQWSLRLTPLESGQVKQILIAGRRGELSSMEMDLLGGDRSVMTIEPLRSNRTASTASAP